MASKDEILAAMLSHVPGTYDKRAGSFIYDALAPVAEKLAELDINLQGVADKLPINNLKGDELEQRVYERTGIKRKAATSATGYVSLTGTGTINEGDLFETQGGVQFRATETKAISGSGTVSVEAVIPGSSGNVAAYTITLFPVTLPGFTAVTNPESTHYGFDAESDNDLLTRYYERIQTPATSGNRAHYLNWAKEVPGVGDAKVVSLWDGPGTVKVIIIDANREPASPELVADVQEYIDPNQDGSGEGVAPIGAVVTVASAESLEIDISANVEAKQGYTQEMIEDSVEASIAAYLKEIAFKETTVSYAKIGAAILASEGVADYSGLTVNSGTSNVTVADDEVAILGTVTLIVD